MVREERRNKAGIETRLESVARSPKVARSPSCSKRKCLQVGKTADTESERGVRASTLAATSQVDVLLSLETGALERAESRDKTP